MDELFGLVGDRAGHRRMAMPQADRADAGNEVEIFFVLVIENRHAVAGHQLHRFAGKGVHDIG